jgi:TolA-binding protein
MKGLLVRVVIPVALVACAHVPGGRAPDAAARVDLWREAHMAMFMENFARADSLFARLATEYPATEEAREAIFYIGSLNLDPRNQNWNSERAETALRRYLQQDTVGNVINRRPEATILLELARQLNLPPGERFAALQPEIVEPVQPPPRRVSPTDQLRDLQRENEQLRRELSQRDEQIRQQREELDRIRRALAPRTP